MWIRLKQNPWKKTIDSYFFVRKRGMKGGKGERPVCVHTCVHLYVCVWKMGVWGRKEGIDQRWYLATLKCSTIQLLKELRRNTRWQRCGIQILKTFQFQLNYTIYIERRTYMYTHTHTTLLIPFASPWCILCRQNRRTGTKVPETAFFKDLS